MTWYLVCEDIMISLTKICHSVINDHLVYLIKKMLFSLFPTFDTFSTFHKKSKISGSTFYL
jgi:hypothetical protein